MAQRLTQKQRTDLWIERVMHRAQDFGIACVLSYGTTPEGAQWYVIDGPKGRLRLDRLGMLAFCQGMTFVLDWLDGPR